MPVDEGEGERVDFGFEGGGRGKDFGQGEDAELEVRGVGSSYNREASQLDAKRARGR